MQLITAVLITAASFLPLATRAMAAPGAPKQFSVEWRAWFVDFKGLDTRAWLVGAALALSGVLALAAGVSILAGIGRRSRGERFVCLASGLSFGVTLTVVLNTVSVGMVDTSTAGFSFGSGFWVLILTVVMSGASMITSILAARGAVPHPTAHNHTGDVVTAVLLGLTAVTVVAGSFFDLLAITHGGYSAWRTGRPGHTTFQITGAALVFGALVAVVTALLLFTRAGVTVGRIRAIGSLAAGLVFGPTLTMVLKTVSEPLFGGFQFADLGPGLWILSVAALLSIGAIISSLVSDGGTALPPDPAPHPTYHAQHPTPAMPQHFTPAHQAPTPNWPSAAAQLRMARVYDGRDASGRPIIDRPPLDPSLRDALLTYLESAPVVLAARGFEADDFAPADRDVPMTFRTDGTWIWAGAVPHYLRKYGVPPEPELLRHIVARGFRVADVDDVQKDMAVRAITGA